MEAESIETRGRTTEEAIRIALEQLGLSRDEVEVEVLAEGRAGVFGVGFQEARVRVTVLEEEEDEFNRREPSEMVEVDEEDAEEDAELARETLEHLLDLLDFPNVVTVRNMARDRDRITICLDVAGDDVGLIIGRHGETLQSLQFLINALLNQRLPRNTRVSVDVEHYRDRREQSLRAIALRAADRARRDRHAVTLEPMPPNERRIIHLTLQTSQYVSTESEGEGAERRVVITPKPSGPSRRPSSGYQRGTRG